MTELACRPAAFRSGRECPLTSADSEGDKKAKRRLAAASLTHWPSQKLVQQ